MSTLVKRFFLRHGRISRGSWLFRLTAMALFCTAFGMLLQSTVGDRGAVVASVIFLWSAGTVSIQRLHDISQTGWVLLALLIPVLGPIWLLVQLLRRGVEGKNRYGPDPAARADYLQVNIAK